MTKSEKRTCFVIMPFSGKDGGQTTDYWTKHFEGFLKPVIEGQGACSATRSRPFRGDIVGEIVKVLVTADIVVADLSELNPNVFWELGVRQSFKHGTITIAKEGTKPPFDVGGKGVLFYDPSDHADMERFREELLDAIDDCVNNPERPDSSVLEARGGRGTLFEIVNREINLKRLGSLVSECGTNITRVNSINKQVKTNLKDSDDRTYSTVPLRDNSVALFISECYSDPSSEMIKTAGDVLDNVLSINGQLLVWENSPDETEKWLERNTVIAKRELLKLRKLVETEMLRLSDSP